MGKLQDFEVQFDHPQGVYHAGEVLRGHVYINLSEPMNMRNVRLWLYGRAKVHWSRTTGSGKNRRTIHYRAEEEYFDQTFILFGSRDTDEQHPAGVHRYNFELPLNAELPSSYEGDYGYVRYLAKATIDKPWKFDHECKAAFTVLSVLDLNTEPTELRTSMQGEDGTEVSCCCCVSGNVRAMFRIDRRGFVPGEHIQIYAEVHNGSNTNVNQTRVAIKQYVEFYGVSDSLFSSGSPKPKVESFIIASAEKGEIAAGETFKWENFQLRIPPIPPSRLVGCSIINISYVVKFYVSVNYGSDIKLASDVVIGTVPLRELYPQYYGAPVMTQPQAAFAMPSAPPPMPIDMRGPPQPTPGQQFDKNALPSYEEYVGGQVHIREDHDSEFTRGRMQWAPVYTMYSLPPPPTAPPSAPPTETELENRV